MYRNIIVAYDRSDGARAALDTAAEFARVDGASLTLVQSVPEETAMLPPGGRAPDPEAVADVRHGLEEVISSLDPELEASPWIVAGSPGEAILAVVEEIEPDLIVTGSRSRGPVARALLGSTSTHLVSNATCDVLVVHPRED
jgi:nucleotide-binding universal stress UspA family protein